MNAPLKCGYGIIVVISLMNVQCSKNLLTKYTPPFNDFLSPNEIHVGQFGAVPNDGKDDSPAIQSVVNYAITSTSGAVIRFDAGVYDIHKGITLVNRLPNGQLQFIDISLLGHSPAFSAISDFGRNTVLRSHNSGFTLAVQKGRSCTIENIAFTGLAPKFQSASIIMQATPSDWSANGKVRLNRYSPNCAIVIDPFYRGVLPEEQYPGFDAYYQNTSTEGTSVLNIEGCSFTGYYMAIAVNPSNGVENGDNIVVESSYVESCHTFWACGQTQSRNNHVRDVYALYLHTFISGVDIGQQIGTPPFVTGVNIGGFCKYVFNVHTPFSGLGVQQSYMEGIWSLGYAMVNAVSFHQCQIQFRLPDTELFAPMFHLYSHAPVHLTSCGIEYFNNCLTPAPILMRAGALRISGGWIEGGVISANGITNEGGDEAHQVEFDNVWLKCVGKIAGKVRFEQPFINLAHDLFLGGTTLSSSDGSRFISQGASYHFVRLGPADVVVDLKTKTATFTSTQAGVIKEGDNLYITNPFTMKETRYKDYTIRPHFGFVKEIAQNIVTVACVPEDLPSGEYDICILDHPIFIPPLWGRLETGSPIIHDVETYADSFYPRAGTRISSSGFPHGTYVLNSNPEQRMIQMSMPALRSSTSQLIRGKEYDQVVDMETWVPEKVGSIIEGANIHLLIPFQSGFHFINTTKAIKYTQFKPTLSPRH